MLLYRFWMIRPRPRLYLRTIAPTARDLHKQMYEHFAAGNLAPIEHKICEGMLGSLRSRIAQRNPNTSLKWTLHKYIGRPSIFNLASYRAAIFPGQKGEMPSERNGIVQAVVRIRSLQSLQHVKRSTYRDESGRLGVKEMRVDTQGHELGPVEEGVVPANAKESVEYIVIQKMLKKGKEGPWMIWGTAEETTLEKIRREDKKMQQQLLGETGA